MAVRGFDLVQYLEFFNCVWHTLCMCLHKNTVQALLLYSWIKKFAQENVKNCTLILHFASASCGLCPPDSLLGICTRPHFGPKFPRPPGSTTFTQFLIHPLWTPSIVKYWVCRWWHPSKLPSIQGSWLWLFQTYWGNMRSPHIGYYLSCYLYKILSIFHRCGVFAGNSVWSTSERLVVEILTIGAIQVRFLSFPCLISSLNGTNVVITAVITSHIIC